MQRLAEARLADLLYAAVEYQKDSVYARIFTRLAGLLDSPYEQVLELELLAHKLLTTHSDVCKAASDFLSLTSERETVTCASFCPCCSCMC